MPETRPAPTPAKLVRLIHLALAASMTLAAGVMVGLRLGDAAMVSSATPMHGLIMAGISVMAIAISLAIFRPRVGQRGSDQSADDFWRGKPHVAAFVTWALIESGALLSVAGFFLTGTWTSLAVVPVALLAFFITRPASFE